jgi:DNA replication protein DnaC
MATRKKPDPNDALLAHLDYLKLSFLAENYLELAQRAAEEHWDYLTFLAHLLEGEVLGRQTRAVERRIRLARFPVPKTLAQFDWSWPRKINRLQVQNLFRLNFIEQHANVIFVGGVGLGKSHLVTALGLAACERGYSVLFASAVDVVNTLAAAQRLGQLKTELRKYLRPRFLVLDELGYLPIDKTGADLLFQIISQRYERGSTAITTNRTYKKWPSIFNNDATLTSAVLDRLLHHAETVRIEGNSFRMKDQINKPADTSGADPAKKETANESAD